MRGRIGFALAALVCAAQCGTTGTPPTSHAFPVQELTLPSGLKVVIEHDDVSTIAGVVVVVDAGSVDDPKGKAGAAHVLEHLVFRAADEGGKSLWNQLVRMGAASFNAETDIERTTYHVFGPRQTLDELFEAWNMGWEPAVLDDYPRDLADVTAKDVIAALDVRRSAVISVLGPGPNADR